MTLYIIYIKNANNFYICVFEELKGRLQMNATLIILYEKINVQVTISNVGFAVQQMHAKFKTYSFEGRKSK